LKSYEHILTLWTHLKSNEHHYAHPMHTMNIIHTVFKIICTRKLYEIILTPIEYHMKLYEYHMHTIRNHMK
jgi:hypothetical protein